MENKARYCRPFHTPWFHSAWDLFGFLSSRISAMRQSSQTIKSASSVNKPSISRSMSLPLGEQSSEGWILRLSLSAMACIACILCITGSASAQGTLMPAPRFTAFDNNGLIVSGAKLCTYAAGTTTPQATYSDADLAIGHVNTNPVVTDSAGRAVVYLSATSYKFTLYTGGTAATCDGTLLWSQDNVSAVPTTSNNVDVLGTAGETITAGLCAYLSDGSGSKNAGQWYKCDSTNTYSSTTPTVGLAPSAITSGSIGSIRLTGEVTSLTVSAGAEYFVSTGGAITSTAPANRRHLGQADSTTSIVVTANPPPVIGPFSNDFRLTLTTAVCDTTTDVTGASAVTLFLTPCTGNRITLFDSSGNPETCTTAQVSIAVPATTTTVYDVWAYDSTFGTCTVTLETLVWTSSSARATAIARTNGRWTKSGDTSRMYIGTFSTAGSSGQTEDSATKRYLYNQYNQRRRPLLKQSGTATWAYTLATIHQANGDAANQVEAVIGVAESLIDLTLSAAAKNGNSDGSNMIVQVGLGEDSTTAFVAGSTGGSAGPTADAIVLIANMTARLMKTPAVGRHAYTWLEWSQANGATTWYGVPAGPGGPSGSVNGISGWIEQ